MTQKHTPHAIAMDHYENCTFDCIDEDIHDAMKKMQPLYQAAPELLEALDECKLRLHALLVDIVGHNAARGQIEKYDKVIAKATEQTS